MDKDAQYMARALEIAEWGLGSVSPNPLVGCVVVCDGRVVGEGWHRQYGGPHAEVNAIADVKDPAILARSTVYVTLEPCAHHGKTPPCAELLVAKKAKRVVVAATDPNPLVAGKGLAIMRQGGIEVATGVMTKEATALNRRFFTYMAQNRPYVMLKWAETADGFVARQDYSSKWISNALSRQVAHKMRAEEDAVMVGTRTALHDDPKLNVRHWHGKDPVRVVVDKALKLPGHLALFNTRQPTYCYNLHKDQTQGHLHHIKLTEAGFLAALLADLKARKIGSLLVEGGAALLGSFINEGLWDEAWVFKAAHAFGAGIPAPPPPGTLQAVTPLMGDRLFHYTHT